MVEPTETPEPATAQLRERMDRERRARATIRQREYADALCAATSLARDLSQMLRGDPLPLVGAAFTEAVLAHAITDPWPEDE